MLSNLQNGTITNSSENSQKTIVEEPKVETKKEVKKKVVKCDKAKKSLCKGTGGMQLGGSKMKKKKKTTE